MRDAVGVHDPLLVVPISQQQGPSGGGGGGRWPGLPLWAGEGLQAPRALAIPLTRDPMSGAPNCTSIYLKEGWASADLSGE